MNEERIKGALRDATDTKVVTINTGALDSVAEIFEQSFGDATAVLVTDENIWAAAGEQVEKNL